VLLVKQIGEINGKEFAIQLKRAELYYKASENFKLQSTKDELTKVNVNFKDKYDYFEQFFGTKKTQTSVLIKVGNLDKQIISDYVASTSKHTIDNLISFAKGDKQTDMNTTTEGINERTETIKPLKFASDKKGIEIKVNGTLTADEKKQALEFIKNLQTK
jgi:hypothetical protein